MNKNLAIPFFIVVVLGCGVWWFISHTTPKDAFGPTPTASASMSPNPSLSISPTPSSSAVAPAITITSPKVNALVDSPITVTGRARVFENQFMVRLKDNTGKVLSETSVMTDAKDSSLFGNYSVKIPVPPDTGSNFKIESLSYSPKGDGSLEGYASVAVRLKTTDVSSIYVAFVTGDDCNTVTLYPRSIIKSPEYVYMSLVELLKGPTSAEIAQGANNQIPSGVKINSFRMQGDTVYADFDQTLQQGVAGSCRVQAIRSQITNTLKQFLGLNNVVISINGKTAGILQP